MEPEKEQPSNLIVFLDYFIPFIVFVVIMLNRTLILKLILKLIHYMFDPLRKTVFSMDKKITQTIDRINKQEFVFFTKGDNIATLNKVMLYIIKNEHTKKIKIVHVVSHNESIPKNLAEEIKFLDREYPQIKIEFIIEEGIFGPELINQLSKRWNIPVNFIFIGSPSEKFEHKVEDLGGVRLII